MTDTSKRTVFFVDDQPGVCKIVGLAIEERGYNVTCFTDAFSCLQVLQQEDQRCDLLITDVNMSGMDGIELLTESKRIRPLLPVLVVTAYGDIPLAVRAVKAGAIEFIEKPLDENVLLPAIDTALKANAFADSLAGRPLTETESKVLQMIVEDKTSKEIAYILGRSTRTVDTHRHHIMRKLNVATTAGLTKSAIAMGLVPPPTETRRN